MGKILDALNGVGALFEVQKTGLYSGATFEEVQDFRAVTRADNNEVLGVVGAEFHLISHGKAFGGVDELLPSLELLHGEGKVSAHVLTETKRGTRARVRGSVVGVEVAFPQSEARKSAPRSGLHPRLLFRHGLAGDSGLRVEGGIFVQVCSNGLVVGRKDLAFTLRHTSGIRYKLERMEALISRCMEKLAGVEDTIQAAASTPLTEERAERALRFVLTGEAERGDREARNFDELVGAYWSAPGADPGTVWGVVQAATYYATHLYGRDESNRFFSSLSAPAIQIRERALSLARGEVVV